jgi:hypothetical protein
MGRLILYSITAAVPVSAGLAQTPVVRVLTIVAAVVLAAAALLAVASTLSLVVAALLTAHARRSLQRQQRPQVPLAPPTGLHRSAAGG